MSTAHRIFDIGYQGLVLFRFSQATENNTSISVIKSSPAQYGTTQLDAEGLLSSVIFCVHGSYLSDQLPIFFLRKQVSHQFRDFFVGLQKSTRKLLTRFN